MQKGNGGSPTSLHMEVGEEEHSRSRHCRDTLEGGVQWGIALETTQVGGSHVTPAREGQAQEGEGLKETPELVRGDQTMMEVGLVGPVETEEPVWHPQLPK